MTSPFILLMGAIASFIAAGMAIVALPWPAGLILASWIFALGGWLLKQRDRELIEDDRRARNLLETSQ